MSLRIGYLATDSFSEKDLRTAADHLSVNEYTEKVSWGFIDLRNEGDALTATFVERFETEDEISDPFGRVTKYKRIQFSQVSFRLSRKMPQLEVYDAPRSISPLLTELANAFGIAISFSRIRIDLNAFVKFLKNETSSLIMQGATLRNIPLTTDVSANVALAGNGEISPYLKIASLGKKTALNKVSLLGTNKVGMFKLEIASDGRIQISGANSEDLLMRVREIIEKCLD